MTERTAQDRAEFEAVFGPPPYGCDWNGLIYTVSITRSHTASQYVAQWMGWRAARASQPAGVPDAVWRALATAEAALADIGDADRDPGDDVAWCEARAAEALPEVRATLSVRPAAPAAEKPEVQS